MKWEFCIFTAAKKQTSGSVGKHGGWFSHLKYRMNGTGGWGERDVAGIGQISVCIGKFFKDAFYLLRYIVTKLPLFFMHTFVIFVVTVNQLVLDFRISMLFVSDQRTKKPGFFHLRDFLFRGPLYRKVWLLATTLVDTSRSPNSLQRAPKICLG